ncbi:MAG: hypothetical protein GWO22_13435, partial [Actinobacteria bacterium]|nr:hypothetical protein [Actinomycetota bacterium]NIT96896.1 hypothetical protein [Actinomycetota bacterium]NIX51878.1 hypothetical protein [Actinomycetota bacterium]
MDDATAPALLETALAGTERILDALRRGGQVADTGSGTVVQLSRSGGGVPKTPVPAAAVGLRGLEGDRQAVRRH